MKPLEIIYWLRFTLGIIAALVCVGFGLLTGTIRDDLFTFSAFTDGLLLAVSVYFISYYIIKWRFLPKVEKPQKILTTGIGAYILSWLVFWILLYTILAV
ncbi:MAG: hypothetical protein QXH37_00215 [Candidatus Bathyarchaeia archaeon]